MPPLGGAGYVGGPGGGNPLSGYAAHLLELCEHGDGRHRQDLRERRRASRRTTDGVSRCTRTGASPIRPRDSSRSRATARSTGASASTSTARPSRSRKSPTTSSRTSSRRNSSCSARCSTSGSTTSLGLYYFTEEGFVHDFVPFQGLLYVYDYQNDVDTESYAAFLHVDFKITDRFGITVGGRYTKEDKKLHRRPGRPQRLHVQDQRLQSDPERSSNPLPFDPGRIPNPAGSPASRRSASRCRASRSATSRRTSRTRAGTSFTPTVGLQYDFTDDVMAYVKYSKGFKSGGWTTRLSQPISDGSQAEFEPEFAETYELGLKSELFDNRLLMNIAVFTTDYKDIQLNFQEGASPVLHNAGDATIRAPSSRRRRSSAAASASRSRAATSMPSTTTSIRDRHHDRQRDPEDAGVQDQRRTVLRLRTSVTARYGFAVDYTHTARCSTIR